MRLTTAVARTRHEEAVVAFRKSLYTALTDVERALSARSQLAQQEAAQQRALAFSAAYWPHLRRFLATPAC